VSVADGTAPDHSDQVDGGALESPAIKPDDHASSHSFTRCPASALGFLLAKPLNFVPATRLTRDDELSIIGTMKILNCHVSDHQLRRSRVS